MKKIIVGCTLFVIIVLVLILSRCEGAGAATTAPGATGSGVPTISWPHAPGHYPYVVVESHAPDYPVKAAVKKWRAILHYGKCSSHPHNPCVKVYEKHWGHNGILGLSPMVYTVEKQGHILRASVEVNRWYARHHNYNYRLQTVTHELGHTIGLKHDETGVMKAMVSGHYTKVSSYERALMRWLYGV